MKPHATHMLFGALLLVIGYCLGTLNHPQFSYAQTSSGSDNFHVVPASLSTSRSSRSAYYVIAADGVAREVKVSGKPLLAPPPMEIDQIKLMHSGLIRN